MKSVSDVVLLLTYVAPQVCILAQAAFVYPDNVDDMMQQFKGREEGKL